LGTRAFELAADARRDCRHGRLILAAQDVFQNAELLDAIDIDFSTREGNSARFFAGGEVELQSASWRPDNPGSGHEVAHPKPVAIEQRKEHEDGAPAERGETPPTADLARVDQKKAQRQKQLEPAHGVAGEEGVKTQRPPAAGGNAQAERALAERGSARRQLEGHEIEIAQEERAQKPNYRDELTGRAPQGQRHKRCEQRHNDQGGDDDGDVDEEGRRAFAHFGEPETEVDAFRSDQAALALREFGNRNVAGCSGGSRCAFSRAHLHGPAADRNRATTAESRASRWRNASSYS